MIALADLRCSDCGSQPVMSVWPGKEGLQGELFSLTPYRLVRCWCEKCWLKRYGSKPTLPRRGRQPKSAI